MNTINAVHIMPYLNLPGAGSLVAAAEIVERLYSLQVRPQVWSHPYTNAFSEKEGFSRKTGIPLNMIHLFNTWPGPKFLVYSPSMKKQVLKKEQFEADILHQHGVWTCDSMITCAWKRKFNRPTVITPHGMLEPWRLKISKWKKKCATLFYESKNLHISSCLHVTAEKEIQDCRGFGLKNPVAFIPLGIDDQWLSTNGNRERFISKYNIPKDRKILLYLSRIHPVKGLPMLFQAIRNMGSRFNEWMLLVAGQDYRGYEAKMKEHCEQLGINQVVKFVGPLFLQDKRDAFEAADVFILPTHSDNFAIAIAEALGASKPVITTHGAPWKDISTHECGWWVDIHSQSIYDALCDMCCKSREDLLLMGKRGKTLVAEKYLWSITAKKILALYQWLLGKGDEPNFIVLD